MNQLSGLYRFRALLGGDGTDKVRYPGTLLYFLLPFQSSPATRSQSITSSDLQRLQLIGGGAWIFGATTFGYLTVTKPTTCKISKSNLCQISLVLVAGMSTTIWESRDLKDRPRSHQSEYRTRFAWCVKNQNIFLVYREKRDTFDWHCNFCIFFRFKGVL